MRGSVKTSAGETVYLPAESRTSSRNAREEAALGILSKALRSVIAADKHLSVGSERTYLVQQELLYLLCVVCGKSDYILVNVAVFGAFIC